MKTLSMRKLQIGDVISPIGGGILNYDGLFLPLIDQELDNRFYGWYLDELHDDMWIVIQVKQSALFKELIGED